MVASNSHCQFLAKICKFFGDNNACKRHRLYAAYVLLTHACMVAYTTAYIGSPQSNVSLPNLTAGHMRCSEKFDFPVPSCAVLQNSL
jgi:hypothetical protein